MGILPINFKHKNITQKILSRRIATVNRDTEIGHLLEQARCGFCIDPENADELAQTIMQLREDDPLRIEMGECGRNFVVEKYSRQVAAEQYRALIQHFLAD